MDGTPLSCASRNRLYSNIVGVLKLPRLELFYVRNCFEDVVNIFVLFLPLSRCWLHSLTVHWSFLVFFRVMLSCFTCQIYLFNYS